MALIAKADIPDDPSQWEEGTIKECVGTPDEHEDKFYRSGNWGIEEHADGKFQIYAIVDEDPMMVRDQMNSFEECVQFIRENAQSKELSGSSAPEGEMPEEGEEDETEEDMSMIPSEPEGASPKPEIEPVAEIAIAEEVPAEDEGDEPPAKEEDKGEEEDKKDEGEDKKEDNSEGEKEEKDEKTEKSEKSIKSMLQSRESSKTRGAPAGMANRNCNAINKSKNCAGVDLVYLGTGKDYVGFGQEVKNAQTNADGVSTKKVESMKKSAQEGWSIRDMIAFKKSGGSFAKQEYQTHIDTEMPDGENAWSAMDRGDKMTAPKEIGESPDDATARQIDGMNLIGDSANQVMADADPVGDVTPHVGGTSADLEPHVGGTSAPADGAKTATPITDQASAQEGGAEPTPVDTAMTESAENPELVSDDAGLGAPSEGAPGDVPLGDDTVLGDPGATDDMLADATMQDESTLKSAKNPSELPMKLLMQFKKSGMDFETFKKWATPAEDGTVQSNLDDWGKVGDAQQREKKAKAKYQEASKDYKDAKASGDKGRVESERGNFEGRQANYEKKRDQTRDAEYEATHTA